ncbi:MAG: PEP-CTERM sorting domain-containing protein [Nitrospirota bacterium]|nr:PEP-CTERM sorting domain-containing protein [Nitrospirota bacterium]
MNKDKLLFIVVLTMVWMLTVAFVGVSHAAIITFDDLITGATSYSFDGDGDSLDDVIFTTTDPYGFNTVGPGTNMTYIDEPGLEGTSLLSTDLRVDFIVGAEDSLSFGFALDSYNEDDTASFYIYDSTDTLLASTTVTGLYTATSYGTSTYPEGYISLSFLGTASYATFNFTSDYGRYIIDNFEGTYGTTERVPEPGTLLLIGSGLVGLAFARKKMK